MPKWQRNQTYFLRRLENQTGKDNLKKMCSDSCTPSNMEEKPMLVNPNHIFWPFQEGHTSLLSTCKFFASWWTKLITKTVSIPTHLSCLADNLNLYANLIFGGFRILQRWHLQASWTKARYNDHRQTLACHDATKEELSLGSSTSRERFQIVHFNPLSKFQTF